MSNPQGTGGAIEEAAKEALHHDSTSPVDHYAQQAAEFAEGSTNRTPNSLFMQAQQHFISDQTRFIHDKDQTQMRGAHMQFIVALLDFIAATDTGLALTLGERYITDMQNLLVDRKLI